MSLDVPTRSLDDPTTSEIEALDAWWRASLYLTVGQIYLGDNALLREPLRPEHVKPRLLGHWGTSPGLAFVYAHVSRLIRETGQEAIYLAGPGHGGPALVAASWLEGTYTERFPHVTRDEEGMHRLFRQFSTPGGIPSHVSVTTPGSIHEGGELGYVLVHAFGAVMDNPDLVAVAVVGDGEAETGPLEGSWKGISFLNPTRDGAVLPVLHLNDAKISGPTVLGRKDPDEVRALFAGHGYDVLEVEGSDLPGMHHRFAAVLAEAWARIREIQDAARSGAWDGRRPRWPMIVLRTPKGWTGPARGRRRAGRGHLPRPPGAARAACARTPRTCAMLEAWMRSYRPEELFDATGRPTTDAVEPAGAAADERLTARQRRHPAPRPCACATSASYAVDVPSPGTVQLESTRRLGRMLRDVYADNPHELPAVLPRRDQEQPARATSSTSRTGPSWRRCSTRDEQLSRDGRVMEVLSEHNCHGWLEGYTLTGRHGLFATYEAFAMVSASQTVQHSKWLEEAADLPWRAPVPSLNVLLTSTAWRNDHNGFSHQGPGLIQVLLTHRGDGHPGLPAAGRQLPALGGRPLPALTRLRQPDRDRQAAAAAVPRHRGGGRRTARPARAPGSGPATTTAARRPTWCWPAPGTSRRWRRWRPRRSCASRCRSCAPGWSTWST